MIRHGLDYRHVIQSLVTIASLASRLKTAQREQIQSTRQLAKDFDMKWDQRLGIEDEAHEREEGEISEVESQSLPPQAERKAGVDLMRAMERLVGVNNALEDGLIKKTDSLLRGVRVPWGCSVAMVLLTI